jgi:hypothetical protein
MPRCPNCDYPLPEDRQRVGARCPNCHEPLYEPPGRIGRPARPGEGICPVHAGIEAVGVCARCGNYLCEVCRTRWRGQIVCAACVDRALESSEATPAQDRAHLRQAVLSLAFGGGAWVVFFLLLVVVGLAQAGGSVSVVLVGLAGLVMLGMVLVAALGIGQAVAALRARGDHMILATLGMIVSGLYAGALIGLLAMSLWLN